MKQTHKSLLSAGIFLLVAAGVAGVAVWVKKDEEKKTEQKEKAEKLFAFDKAKVRSLRLEKDGKLVAEASRESGDKPWSLIQPVKAEADQSNVNAIVEKLADLKQKKDLGSEGDSKAVGLDAPRWKIALGLEDKSAAALEVGLENSFDSSLYVRKPGEPTIRIVDGWHKSAWDKSAFDLRDKRVLHLDETAEVRAFTIVDDEPYTLRKEGNDWKLTGPGHETPEPADGDVASRVIAALKGLRANAVVAESPAKVDLARLGFKDPKVVAELNEIATPGSKDTYRRKLEIAQAGGKTYARRDDAPAVFEVDAQILKDLEKTWFEVQDKTVAKFDREQVKTLQIDAPGAAQIAVARTKESKDGGVAEESFAVEAPASGAAKKWKISSSLYALASLKAAAFVGLPPRNAKENAKYGLDKPRTYSVLGEGGKLLARIKLGKDVDKNDKRLYALAEGGARVVELEKTLVNDLPVKLEDILEPPAPPAPAPDGGAQASVPK